MAYSNTGDVFVTAGKDGSIRRFDLRSLEHSTIMFETADCDPLLRVRWNHLDPSYIATFGLNNNSVIILDIRVHTSPVAELHFHKSVVNGISWSQENSSVLATCGDDGKCSIWDLSHSTAQPECSFQSSFPVNNIEWGFSESGVISMTTAASLSIQKI